MPNQYQQMQRPAAIELRANFPYLQLRNCVRGELATYDAGYLGFRHTEFTAGRLVAEMDARDDLKTPFGNLHGGCLSAMVDHCLGVVFYPVIPMGSWVATTEFKLNLLRPVSSGTCVAAEIISLGRTSGVARIDICNDGRAVCAAQGTVTVVAPKTTLLMSANRAGDSSAPCRPARAHGGWAVAGGRPLSL